MSDAEATSKRATRRTKERKVRVDLTLCRYEVVRKVVRDRGWTIVSDEEDTRGAAACNLHWVDVPEVANKFTALLPYQKLNHFPGMSNLARKSRLARNFDRLRKLFPSDYDFCPKTWILPFDMHDFSQHFGPDGTSARPFIVKPDHSCQGRGVFLTRKLADISRDAIFVAQQYVARPLLIEGKKFDLRIYVLVTSCAPLRVYLFQDGLVRMCTAKYVVPTDANLEQRFMHLTNYAVNKRATNFEQNANAAEDGQGSKRSLRWFFNWLRESRDGAAVDELWRQIGDICLKSILSVQPVLAQEYRSTFAKYMRHAYSAGPAGPSTSSNAGAGGTRPASARTAHSGGEGGNPNKQSCCFALLGMDVLVDEHLKPWLLEVNHLPSFGCDSPLDWNVKERLIGQTFDLLQIAADDKDRYETAQARSTQRRLYGASSDDTGDNQADGGSLPPIKSRKQQQQQQQPESEGDADANGGGAAPLSHEALKTALERFYAAVAPDRTKDLAALATKYADRQDALNRHLERKYGRRLTEEPEVVAAPSSPTKQDVSKATVPAEEPATNEDEQLIDYVRLFPPPGQPMLEAKYRQMLEASQQHMNELQMRFSAPLQHRRASVGDESDGAGLPPISGAARRDQQVGRDCFGFTGTDKARWLNGGGEKKTAAVPGPQQVAAAHRLMLGHSSQKQGLKPPTPPERVPRARQETVDFGLQYRDRLATLKQKPTLQMAQISFGSFN